MKAEVFKFLNESKLGSITIAVLIFASVINFTVETEYPELALLRHLDIAIALVFMVEYFARIWTADYNRKDKMKARRDYIFPFTV